MKESSDTHRDQPAAEHLHDVHLPTLLGRMLDDLVRIGEAQAKLFEVNIGAALAAALDRAVGRVIAAIMYLVGGLCLLGAIILLLRRRLLWWEALVISGTIVIGAGALTQWVTGKLAARRAHEAELGHYK